MIATTLGASFVLLACAPMAAALTSYDGTISGSEGPNLHCTPKQGDHWAITPSSTRVGVQFANGLSLVNPSSPGPYFFGASAGLVPDYSDNNLDSTGACSENDGPGHLIDNPTCNAIYSPLDNDPNQPPLATGPCVPPGGLAPVIGTEGCDPNPFDPLNRGPQDDAVVHPSCIDLAPFDGDFELAFGGAVLAHDDTEANTAACSVTDIHNPLSPCNGHATTSGPGGSTACWGVAPHHTGPDVEINVANHGTETNVSNVGTGTVSALVGSDGTDRTYNGAGLDCGDGGITPCGPPVEGSTDTTLDFLGLDDGDAGGVDGTRDGVADLVDSTLNTVLSKGACDPGDSATTGSSVAAPGTTAAPLVIATPGTALGVHSQDGTWLVFIDGSAVVTIPPGAQVGAYAFYEIETGTP